LSENPFFYNKWENFKKSSPIYYKKKIGVKAGIGYCIKKVCKVKKLYI